MKPALATTSSRRPLRSCSGRWLTSRPFTYSTSNAMRTGGVATIDSSGSRSHSDPGLELVVEQRQLAVENQRRGLELRECGRDVRVAAGVVDAAAAHQADAGAVLVGQHAVTVDLLFVDPARAMEGRADERGPPSASTGGSPS